MDLFPEVFGFLFLFGVLFIAVRDSCGPVEKWTVIAFLALCFQLLGFSAGHRCASDGTYDIRDHLAESSYNLESPPNPDPAPETTN